MRLAKLLIMLPVLVLVAALALNVAWAYQDRPQLHEVDKPVFVERDVEVTPIKAAAPTAQPRCEKLGEFELTAYCPCYRCCGKYESDPEYRYTATMTYATEGRTVAVDPDVIPLGSILYIDGHRYVAEDVGGAIEGNIIDVFFETHEAALEFGRQTKTVWIWRADNG